MRAKQLRTDAEKNSLMEMVRQMQWRDMCLLGMGGGGGGISMRRWNMLYGYTPFCSLDVVSRGVMSGSYAML